MHTIMYDDKNRNWSVMRSDILNGSNFLTPMFHKLSLATAAGVCASLNGAGFLNPDSFKVLEMCKV